MNPLQAANLNYDILTIINPDSEPFEVVYDSQSYGIIMPGQQIRMPRFLAEHAMKHLIDQCLNRLNIPLTSRIDRDKYAAKILVDSQETVRPTPLSAREQLHNQVQALNSQTDLERLADSKANKPDEDGMLPEIDENALDNAVEPLPQTTAPVDPTPPPAPPQTTETVETTPASSEPLPSLVPAGVDPELAQASATAQAQAEAGPNITRPFLYDYARNVLKMDLTDQKTMAAFENMSVPELRQELQYDENML